VTCDLQLTLMGSSLYRLLASQIGQGYERAKSRHLFQDFVEASAHVMITEREVVVASKSERTIHCWQLRASTRPM
jgi:hypothetical protein